MSHKVLSKSNLWHIGAWDGTKMTKTARIVPGCPMSEKCDPILRVCITYRAGSLCLLIKANIDIDLFLCFVKIKFKAS